jgi:alkylated DNA repair protein alkB family protein 6
MLSSDSTKASLSAFRIQALPPDFYYIPDFVSAEEEASILSKVSISADNTPTTFGGTIPRLALLKCHYHINMAQIPAQRWTQLTHRRLQAHPSTLTKNNTLLASPLPEYLVKPIVSRFKDLGIFDDTLHQQPNHVLINEYKPGEGIMPHEDGSTYAPVVATVSLGSTLCLDITPKSRAADSKDGTDSTDDTNTSEVKYSIPTRILQEPRSLLITTGDAYGSLLHGISPVGVDENLNASTVANWSLLTDRRRFVESEGRNARDTRISLTYRDVLKVSSAASKVFGGLVRK